MDNQTEVHVFVRFLELIQKHFKEEGDISFYAGKLEIEPEELSRIILNRSDSSFADWISTME